MGNIRILLLLLIPAIPSFAQDTVRMTLAECLDYSFRHNVDIRTARLSQENAVLSLEAAKLKFTPTLTATAGENWNMQDGNNSRNGSYGINAGMTLFSGFSNLNNYRQSKIALASSKAQVEQSANTVGAKIIESYLTILMNSEKLSYQEEVVHCSYEQMMEARTKWEVGKMLESDYLLLEANHNNARVTMENTALTIANNMIALRTLMGCDSVVDVIPLNHVFSDTTIAPLDSVKARAMRSMPDYVISDLDVEHARYGVKLAKSAYLPTLSVSAGSSHYGGHSGQLNSSGSVISTDGVSTNFGVNLSLPIFNQGTHRTQLKQNKINLQQAEINRQQTLRTLNQQIEGQYLSTRQALNQYHSAAKLQQAYKASYDTYAAKYAEGMVTTVAMLQQQDQYLSATNDYLQSKYSFLLSRMVLDIYTGNNTNK